MLVLILNDQETFTSLKGCRIELIDDSDMETWDPSNPDNNTGELVAEFTSNDELKYISSGKLEMIDEGKG